MSRPRPTTPAEVPDPEEIEAATGPEETALYDAQGRLTTVPTVVWARWDQQTDDPRRGLVAAMYEGLEREGLIEDARTYIEAL